MSKRYAAHGTGMCGDTDNLDELAAWDSNQIDAKGGIYIRLDEVHEKYSSGELVRMALEGSPFDPLRVLATYADESNWTRVHDQGRCWWAWSGPTIVGYELANNGFKFGIKRWVTRRVEQLKASFTVEPRQESAR